MQLELTEYNLLKAVEIVSPSLDIILATGDQSLKNGSDHFASGSGFDNVIGQIAKTWRRTKIQKRTSTSCGESRLKQATFLVKQTKQVLKI